MLKITTGSRCNFSVALNVQKVYFNEHVRRANTNELEVEIMNVQSEIGVKVSINFVYGNQFSQEFNVVHTTRGNKCP